MSHDPTDLGTRKPFPIPLVALGPGSQAEDETLDYIKMPQGMSTWQPPHLPEPEQLAGHDSVRAVLHAVQDSLRQALAGEPPAPIGLDALDSASRALVNQVLGEGEVSLRVAAPGGGRSCLDAQESVYAGVWRVVRRDDDTGAVRDSIEVGAAPGVLLGIVRSEPHRGAGLSPQAALPPDVMNAPSILAELADHWSRRRSGDAAHVINLTLLPLAPADLAWLEHEIGSGRVLILSRGYGNCRISNTERPDTWRVVYYNSMDTMILNTIEVVELPEVALAAPEDLADSLERLTEAIEWLEGA
ncbi:MAG TPA: hydrogenase expression/formation protein [Methylibium sp.]|nr:hydrogenase expression/formation protein [Methylibium sp.]